ncbi:hypothetical protein SRABI76_00778 [Microbacterium oxydans]|uniref:DUF1684 domain-containing protein n=1 Tax=Microbacterium oxydans TaxID=82380 RepID=A0A0F0LAY9_9MICO|nr:DUF1684 domain-containing protein [Microbacterium oxydans]KJL29834.1 hypothetical protein RS83_01404 [Microbacterium oxydans]CAH0150435.1 hypothetical protein SRABI76_00778 [Microbacterium oxydans]
MSGTTDVSALDQADQAEFDREWQEWHRAHEARRADPHGFLAVTGLHWLSGDPQRITGVPGWWTTGPGGPVVHLAGDERLSSNGQPLSGRHEFGPIVERGGLTVAFDGGVAEVAKRGGHDIVRPRRPDHPYLAGYEGTPSYPADSRWRVPARFVEYVAPRPTEVGAAVDGLTHVYDAPGYLELSLDDETLRLVAFPAHAPGELLLLFSDATSGVTTYAANRSLIVPAPGQDGQTVVDFNRAVNLPCAYTDFATCPLPPAENRLRIAIEAGEQTPLARVQAEEAVAAPA